MKNSIQPSIYLEAAHWKELTPGRQNLKERWREWFKSPPGQVPEFTQAASGEGQHEHI
ncbi:MAG: hypothetical protein AAFV72_24720 [Cyanobacteria bacterium J06635_1]